jgi:predicted AAA+ superfamily ATPase
MAQSILTALESSPVTAILGPRQSGKTFMAQELAGRFGLVHWFDTEDDQDAFRLRENPGFLGELQGLVVIDEVQRMPQIFQQLRVLADRKFPLLRFLILGSASFDLMMGASESLAGRVRFIRMQGFQLDELSVYDQETLWCRGGFPKAFLAPTDQESWQWRLDFVETFLLRDIPSYAVIRHGPQLMKRFWMMVAAMHGQTWNSNQIAKSLCIDNETAKRYLDLLTECFMVRQLPPWTENVGKRIRRSPKIYLRDSGILHALLGIRRTEDLRNHPAYGASWEGFALEHVLALFDSSYDAFAWETIAGAELDLLMTSGSRRLGFEFKATSTPGTTKSMRIAISDLKLDKLYVVHPGTKNFELDSTIHFVGLRDIRAVCNPL